MAVPLLSAGRRISPAGTATTAVVSYAPQIALYDSSRVSMTCRQPWHSQHIASEMVDRIPRRGRGRSTLPIYCHEADERRYPQTGTRIGGRSAAAWNHSMELDTPAPATGTEMLSALTSTKVAE